VPVYRPLVHGRGARRSSLGAPLSGVRRVVVAAVAGFVGVGALLGGYGLLSDAEGPGAKESWLKGSPVQDYTVPALSWSERCGS
jgi:hypothetical protein